MRRLLVLALFLAIGAEAVVTPVVDGNTIEAGGRDVRLQGIDASESAQRRGGQPTAALTEARNRGVAATKLLPIHPDPTESTGMVGSVSA